MTAAAWFLVAWFATNALATVALIGRPRPPVTVPAAMVSLVLYGGLIALVVAVVG